MSIFGGTINDIHNVIFEYIKMKGKFYFVNQNALISVIVPVKDIDVVQISVSTSMTVYYR
jgi:hypothetical protein